MTSSYSFVAREEDVDYLRVVREAPKDTSFIIVQERTRKNRPIFWMLLVNKSILSDHRAHGLPLGTQFRGKGQKVFHTWGYDSPDTVFGTGDTRLFHHYRAIGGNGKFPGEIKQQIQRIRAALNPETKNVKATVTLI